MSEETEKYRVIYADPPWSYRNSGVEGSAKKQYPTMSTQDLALFGKEVQRVAHPDSVLLMWATWPLLTEALSLFPAWGYEYVTGFPWVKVTQDPERSIFGGDWLLKPIYGVGFWVRGCTEPLLIGRRGNAKAPKAGHIGLISKNFQHSRKPENVYEYAESLPGPCLELFARRKREGWHSFGDEIESDISMDATTQEQTT